MPSSPADVHFTIPRKSKSQVDLVNWWSTTMVCLPTDLFGYKLGPA